MTEQRDHRLLHTLMAVAVSVTLCSSQPLVNTARAEGEVDPAVLAIEQAFTEVIARAEGAVVSIALADADDARLPNRLPIGWRGRNPEGPTDLSYLPRRFGSGVIIATDKTGNDRFVLTNEHVIRDDRAETGRSGIYVRLSNHRAVRAEIVAADRRSDLAVLRLALADAGIRADDVTPIPLGDATQVRKGQLVLALGNPYAIARDGSASASWGIISNISRRPDYEDEEEQPAAPGELPIHQYGTLLHVDTRLDPGTSGGALVNLKGELIGLTTSLAALRGYEKSVGYAIPINRSMRRVIDSLLQGYEVEYGFLGVRLQDVSADQLRSRWPRAEQSGAAEAVHVAMDSPADRAGLRPGDIIFRIGGVPVLRSDDLMREVGLAGPGNPVTLIVWRPSLRRRLALQVRLGKWPVYDDAQIVATNRRYPPWRGLDVDYPTARNRFLPSDELERYYRAVLLLDVAEDSPAASAGLRPGDFISQINGIPVETPEEFHEAAAQAAGAVTLTRLGGSPVVVGASVNAP